MQSSLQKHFELEYAKELAIPEKLINSYPSFYLCNCPKFKYRIPRHLMFRMMINQKLQGNNPDPYVFVDNIYSGKPNGGFDFLDTKEGINWYSFIADYRIIE